MAEDLAFQQVARDGAAVERDEGLAGPWARLVDRLGGEFLAGAALAGDEDIGPAGGDALDGAVDRLHGRRAADEAEEAVLAGGCALTSLQFGLQRPLRDDEGALLHRVLQGEDQLRLGIGLGQEVGGPGPHHLDRGIHRGIGGDDDDRRLRALRAQGAASRRGRSSRAIRGRAGWRRGSRPGRPGRRRRSATMRVPRSRRWPRRGRHGWACPRPPGPARRRWSRHRRYRRRARPGRGPRRWPGRGSPAPPRRAGAGTAGPWRRGRLPRAGGRRRRRRRRPGYARRAGSPPVAGGGRGLELQREAAEVGLEGFDDPPEIGWRQVLRQLFGDAGVEGAHAIMRRILQNQRQSLVVNGLSDQSGSRVLARWDFYVKWHGKAPRFDIALGLGLGLGLDRGERTAASAARPFRCPVHHRSLQCRMRIGSQIAPVTGLVEGRGLAGHVPLPGCGKRHGTPAPRQEI